MGSPLGPIFADFYMSHLENQLLSDNKISNPRFYRRYVDDIIAIFSKKQHVNWFKIRLGRKSVLNFTHEEMINSKFHFLDINLEIMDDGKFSTSVYIKPTDAGLYANYQSYLPDNYNKSVIKTLVSRALKYSSSWQQVDSELNRIYQVMANNGYPQAIVENIVRNSINKRINQEPKSEENKICLFVKLQHLHTFKKDKNTLKSIISEHVKPTDSNYNLNILAYYKPTKLSSEFSTRPKKSDLSRSGVVYRFLCPEDGCNATYVGYTTCALLRRAKQHRYKQSSIFQHFAVEHQMPPPLIDSFASQFSVVRSFNNKLDLKIAESLIIKQENPLINVKYNECSNFCNLFR
jgi:hypothetical protein